jgi:hypothetical protein
MTDNITLPRAVGERMRKLLQELDPNWWSDAQNAILDVLDAALAEPVHPGYIIGSHWLETAYSRIAAGEAEAEVLTEVLGARGWVKPEPATVEQVAEAYGVRGFDDWWSDYQAAWRAAERFHGIKKEDKT